MRKHSPFVPGAHPRGQYRRLKKVADPARWIHRARTPDRRSAVYGSFLDIAAGAVLDRHQPASASVERYMACQWMADLPYGWRTHMLQLAPLQIFSRTHIWPTRVWKVESWWFGVGTRRPRGAL